ncbi:hypothetical protein [Flagellimonas onchidii]|uniref:hypothetical protein n=1 Tax=Flagellimonas onchidii TaxID=2562684 RepID=UPI0010A6B55E|nr:hypothetical protein [Allomuricauda onchidii]
MKTIISLCVGLFILSLSCPNSSSSLSESLDNCSCDTIRVKETILSQDYLSIDKYDTNSFIPGSLYSLSSEENRLLWFRDIESPDTTKFTPYWNDYVPNNYHASNSDFIKYYKDDKDIEMAFQFGPGGVMWTYYSFVIKKIECCYVITHSSFTHARFRYRAYAFLNNSEMDKLRNVLEPYKQTLIPSKKEYGYHGHFIDNRNGKIFFIDFEKEVDSTNNPTKEIMKLYNFLDDSIKWNVTYST